MPLRSEATPVERRIEFRVGIHLGDVIIDDGDIFGDGVNVAARLEGIADPGGICISRAVRDQVQHKPELELEDLGRRLLKNIEEPVRAYRILWGREAPRSSSQDGALRMPERPSVAIMPFRNLNGDPQNQFIADGITKDDCAAARQMFLKTTSCIRRGASGPATSP